MTLELIKALVPVLIEAIKAYKDIKNIDSMTLGEIRELLEESEDKWPDFKFEKTS